MKRIIKNNLRLFYGILWTAFFTLYEIWAICITTIVPILIIHICAFLFQIVCFCFFTTKFVGIIKKEMKQGVNNGNVYTDAIGNRFKTFD